jgi:hypothetical protein
VEDKMAETKNKNKVEVKVSDKKQKAFHDLLEAIINEGALGGEFLLGDKGESISIFTPDSGWNVTIRKNGTWDLS